MRIMDEMGDEADLQELDFVFNESYGRREPGVQYLATRHFKDDVVNQLFTLEHQIVLRRTERRFWL